MLIHAGADPTIKNKEGQTPLDIDVVEPEIIDFTSVEIKKIKQLHQQTQSLLIFQVEELTKRVVQLEKELEVLKNK